MQSFVTLLFKSLRKFTTFFTQKISSIIANIVFYCNGVYFQDIKSNGIPVIRIARYGLFEIGKNFKINNGLKGNPIGRPQKCTFVVNNNAHLKIGNNVGLSSVAIVCHKSIIIKDNVKIGGGVCIYDTDFHSLDKEMRANPISDFENKISKEIIINSNAFIGAHSTILKGVIIGENAIIGACSVVTKNIPPNEIWGGNPAKYIKKINDKK